MGRSALQVLICLTLLAATAARAEPGQGKKRRPLPPEYGRVVLEAGPEKGRLAPVVFEHWLHRASFTCRLCHVDIGFAMKAGATSIKAADNEAGYFCGACHDGRRVFQGSVIFPACGGKASSPETCNRCHSLGQKVKAERDFAAFTRNLPRGRFGNGVDWEKAELEKLIQPVDYLEGISIKRQSITAQKDFALGTKVAGMPDIIFSHKKHTVWSGCEGCHPEIFVGVKKGLTKYGMPEIFEGKYCGVCHSTVAFPLLDCQRCHTKAVQ
jgi:c(7)-type cytochrome triheme protein